MLIYNKQLDRYTEVQEELLVFSKIFCFWLEERPKEVFDGVEYSPKPLLHIAVEDDGFWTEKQSFDISWLNVFQEGLKTIEQRTFHYKAGIKI